MIASRGIIPDVSVLPHVLDNELCRQKAGQQQHGFRHSKNEIVRNRGTICEPTVRQSKLKIGRMAAIQWRPFFEAQSSPFRDAARLECGSQGRVAVEIFSELASCNPL